MKRRVVITGIGVLSPVGCGKSAFMEGLLSGASGISEIDLPALEDCYCRLHGSLDWDKVSELADVYLSADEKKLSKCSVISIIAAEMAAKDARISFNSLEERMDTGIFFGTTQSDQYAISERIKELEHDRFTALTNTAKHFGIHGGGFFNMNLCASGNHAISYAADCIKNNDINAAFVGGADAFSEITQVGFNRLKALTPDKVRPFDRERNGTVLSEGAAILFIEELEHALNRNAHIYGEILGSGFSNDAYNIVAPDPTGAGIIKAMERAVKDAEISKDDVDFIALHGTGTPANDSAEALAIESFFDSHAKDIRASAIKGSLGHQLGAASATSMTMCALIPEYGMIPPTINVTEQEELGFCLVTESGNKDVPNVYMNNAYAFGGSNCSVIMKRWNTNG